MGCGGGPAGAQVVVRILTEGSLLNWLTMVCVSTSVPERIERCDYSKFSRSALAKNGMLKPASI
jgi:hypothetical protein